MEVAEALLEAYPEAASLTNNYGNLALHFTAWKKGPVDVEKLLLKVYPEGAAQKNNHGNLPLHYAAHYNAPLEVVEALYHAYPEGALQKNNDNNTPLDLAIADGASSNVIALLQGQQVPPTDDEVLNAAKARCERVEKTLQRQMEQHDAFNDDREIVLQMLLDVHASHPHALYSAGIDPTAVTDVDSLLLQVRISNSSLTWTYCLSHLSTHLPFLPSSPCFIGQVRKASAEEASHPPGISDEEIEALIIEDSLSPLDDPVEASLATLIGLHTVKNQLRGLRRTLELTNPPRHFAFVGNPGVGKRTVAYKLADVLYHMGATTSRTLIHVGRDDLVDRKSEARTVFKTRKVLERANGGVLLLDEAYTLLPSTARPRGRDHGAAALREVARALPSGNPVVICTGAPIDLQRILSSEIGFKTHFLTHVEFPDLSPEQIARVFFAKATEKGLVPAEGVTVEYLTKVIASQTSDDYRSGRNGRIAELLLHGVRSEIRKRVVWDDAASRGSLSPIKILGGSSRMPAFSPEEVFVTVEDIQNAVAHGLS